MDQSNIVIETYITSSKSSVGKAACHAKQLNVLVAIC
jgi:hypothetical protein